MERKKKILIIDDSADTVELLRKRLRAIGYDTDEAFDGVEGLAKIEASVPDLVLLDVMMPRLGGIEVLKQIKAKEQTKYLAVIMLTAKSDVQDKVEGFDGGADDYITKPFDFKELAARVRALFAKREANAQLATEEKNGALEYLVNEMAHEIRNPLVSIGGFARRVRDSLPDGTQNKEYLSIIIQNVAVLEKMVAHLVELKSAALTYIEPSNVNDLLLATLNGFEQMFAENRITVSTDLLTSLPLIPADRYTLQQVLFHILENAIEAMTGAVRNLTIKTRESDGFVEILITDTGKGISRDKIKNIFDPFYSSKIYGPGLGLTFVRKTIQSHKGTISVESEEGVGTTFAIRLPLSGRIG